VIKVIWGSGWDALLAADRDGILRARMEACLDGDYQRYSILSGGEQREHWVQDNPALARMMNSLTDDEVRSIKRGGHDAKKLYAAYARACASVGRPTVILVKTVKGEGMGESAQGRNTAHQKKNLTPEERIRCGRDWGIPLPDEALARAEFYRPAEDSEELQYLHQRRSALGGYLPARRADCPPLQPPGLNSLGRVLEGSGERSASTTQVAVRLLSQLLRDPAIGRFIVPIVPDEARTFGMDGLFRQAGIYSPAGQQYTPVDADTLLPYREAADGQILQEGICEAGAMASFMAAGSAYAVHGVPTIPFYIFYSMFGFQRVGDMIWACADMLCRGFLLGGTAGRTTLNGEGLQHQDGHSHVLASTVPCLRSYDPAFGYELALIVRDGIQRMYQDGEDCFYYLTVYNVAYPMPALPEDPQIQEGIVRGGYCLHRSGVEATRPQVHLLGSGAILQEVLQAAEQLEAEGLRVDIWSITSFSELAREALATDAEDSEETPWVTHLFAAEQGLFVAATDYMRAVPESIVRWIPGRYITLGTDGFGRSESRAVLRGHFGVSAACIVKTVRHAIHSADRVEPCSTAQI
jgi:pyruvate dehydrogenase E1 component